jgi:hypothetical protein
MIKPSGPQGAARPFLPEIGQNDPAERIAHALEHIAVSLAALDHNLEVLIKRLPPPRVI